MSRRLRRTKIVTTSNPAVDRNNSLKRVIAAGVNVVRVNLFHDSPEDHKIHVDKVREIVAELGRHVAILGDLQGPEIRVSTLKEDKILSSVGSEFLLDANLGKGEDDREKIGIDYKGLPADVMPGDILLLDDSRARLEILEVQDVKVFTEVTIGGPPSSNKGINRLGDGLSTEALTEKDKADIKIAALIGIDYLAVSFLRYGEDLNCARHLVRDAGYDVEIIAKVEHAKTVCSQKAMDNIILASDVVVVARDDPGVEIGDPRLVGIQKTLVRHACQPNRAVITATQVMESTITNPIPARVEIVGAANAVPDGTDAVMLSAKTVAGQYPSEAVAAMARVCLGAKKIPSINVSKHRLDVQSDNVEEAITMSAVYATNHLKGITAVTTMTESGRAALITSRISSSLPIFAMSRHEHTLDLTALHHGITPVHFDNADDGVAAANGAVNLLRDKDYLMSGDLMIVTQGGVMSTVGFANTMRILTVE